MYKPIQLTESVELKIKERQHMMELERLNIHLLGECTINEQYNMSDIYMEAVFKDGKKELQKIVELVNSIKNKLDQLIISHDAHKAEKKNKSTSDNEKVDNVENKSFDPKAFWKDLLFKELENEIQKVFGFRNVEIHPYIEKYDSKHKDFESKIMNCEISHVLRYPIDGLVTDKGFYDATHSLNMSIYISLGLLKSLSAEEVVAVLLHEFGHSIDPAVVDINYTKINILSKYLTDRKGAINKTEEKLMKDNKLSEMVIIPIMLGFAVLFTAFIFVWEWLKNKVFRDKIVEERITKIKESIHNDQKFNRQNFDEAFADNFARMYGFGPELVNGLKKIEMDSDKYIKSRFTKEIERQNIIMHLTECAMKGVHKTPIHRIRSLIKEYEDDINDPNISPKVKKELQEDLKELQLVLDSYMNDFDEFQNRINRMVNEELEKIDNKDKPKESTNETDPK